MSDLMISKQLPPAIPKRIVQFLIVTDKTLKETRADLLAIKQLEAGSDRYYALLRDAQRLDELKTLAELMLGQILKKMEKNKGGRPSKTCRTRRQVTLKDQKIGRDLSSESQLMASNEKVVYETIEKLRDTDNPYIHAAVIRQIRVGQRRPAKLPPLPEGKYTVLLADPPWPQCGGTKVWIRNATQRNWQSAITLSLRASSLGKCGRSLPSVFYSLHRQEPPMSSPGSMAQPHKT